MRVEIEISDEIKENIARIKNDPHIKSAYKRAMKCIGYKIRMQMRGIKIDKCDFPKSAVEKINTEC